MIIIIIIIIIIIRQEGETPPVASLHSGDWLAAPPITSVGLRLSDEQLRISVAHRLSWKACEPHTCGRGKVVDARGLHGLACRKSASRLQRHSHLNDIIWRAMKSAQIPQVKEPVAQWACFVKTVNATTAPQSCRSRGEAAGTGRHSRRTRICRRPRQQHSHGNSSCSQPCRHQQDHPIQPTISKSHLHPSGHWNSRCLAPSGSWAGPGTGEAGDHHHRRFRPSTCSSSYQWLCKRGTRSRFRTHSQPVSLLFLVF